MKIELKNIKTNNALSEETICFSANVYRDGNKIGTIGNRGCGGDHEYGFDYDEQKLMNEWCKSNLPKWGDDKEYDMDLELHISMMVDEYNNQKFMTSLLRRKIAIVDDTCGYGQCYTWKMPKSSTLDAWIKQILDGNKDLKNPIVLNTLDSKTAFNVMHKEEVA